MLVLTRKQGQGIKIDHRIEVRILSLNGNKVRIGIEAPPEVSIHREEIYEAPQLQTEVDWLAVTPGHSGVPAK